MIRVVRATVAGGRGLPGGLLLWVVLLVATAARAVAVLLSDQDPRLDALDYHRVALAIANGDGFPDSVYAPGGGETALRPPGYPAFLALVYKLVPGPDVAAAQLAQIVLGVALVALVALAATELWGRRAGVAAAALAALYPPLVLLPAALLTENLYLPLQLGAIVVALRARTAPSLRTALAVGGLIGAATLTRQNAWFVLVPLALAFVHRGAVRAAVAPAAAMAAVTALIVVPWTVRNAFAFDALVPVATQSGVLLAGTYNDDARNDPAFPAAWRPPHLLPEYRSIFERRDLDEAELDSELGDRAMRYIRANPEYVPVVGYRNAIRLAQLRARFDQATADDLNLSLAAARLGRAGFYLAAVLALAGLVLGGLRRTPYWVWLVPVVMAAPIFIAGLVRYRYPIDPFLLMLGGFALARLAGRLRPAR